MLLSTTILHLPLIGGNSQRFLSTVLLSLNLIEVRLGWTSEMPTSVFWEAPCYQLEASATCYTLFLFSPGLFIGYLDFPLNNSSREKNEYIIYREMQCLPSIIMMIIRYPPAVLNSFDVIVESIFHEHGKLPHWWLTKWTIQLFLSVSTLKVLIKALYDKTLWVGGGIWYFSQKGGIWYLNTLIFQISDFSFLLCKHVLLSLIYPVSKGVVVLIDLKSTMLPRSFF